MRDIVFIFNGNWSVDDVRKSKDYLFVFGDNDIHSGTGGQAIIRNEPKAGLGTGLANLKVKAPKTFCICKVGLMISMKNIINNFIEVVQENP